MDFWSIYEKERAKPEFGSGKTYIRSRDRIHLSLSTVEQYCVELDMDRGILKEFQENARYVIATDITHDLLLSVYDVNTTRTFLLRFSLPLSVNVMKWLGERIDRMGNTNLEVRAIGMQDRDTELLNTLERMHATFKSSLMELDLFGNEVRHIAFDLKLGMSFNLLLLDRIYTPSELVNQTSKEEFERRKSEFKFI
jgi:hypothetical protein